MGLLWAFLLILVLLVCGALTLFGLPGNWLMIVATVVYVYLVAVNSRFAIGWEVVVALVILAVLGEVIETAAGAWGAAKVGGSRRGAPLALVGSVVGPYLYLAPDWERVKVRTLKGTVDQEGAGPLQRRPTAPRIVGSFSGRCAFAGQPWGRFPACHCGLRNSW